MALADTTYLIDLLTSEEGAVAKLDELIALGEPLWIPTIALHELYYGARLHARHERETTRIRELEHALPPVAFTAEAAGISGRIEAEMVVAVKRPGRADVQIAGTALSRAEAVVSRDRWFETVAGLQVEAY